MSSGPSSFETPKSPEKGMQVQRDRITHVLIVDDDPAILGILERRIGEFKTAIRVLRATNGIEALEVISKEDVDILVTDLNMPKMDGLQLLTQVRESHPKMTRMIITGGNSFDNAAKAEAVSHAFYIKPEGVRLMVKDVIEMSKRNQEKG